jgi:hypothetical protein
MYEHVVYMMNSPFEGWHMIVTLAWWSKNLDSCPKLYNENFLCDGHCVTHKSWVQDASRRVCPDANKNSTYNLRTGSIYYVNMCRFSTWSQKGLISASDDFRKDSIGALQEMVKARIPTITKQALRYELGFSHIWTLTNSHRADR